MGNRQSAAGFNDRFSDERFKGHHGSQSGNIFPSDRVTVATATDPAGNYDGPDSILADSVMFNVEIEVTEVFDGVPTITVGTTADPDAAVTLADAVDLTTPGIKVVSRSTPWPITSVMRVVIGGAPTQGAATVRGNYTV